MNPEPKKKTDIELKEEALQLEKDVIAFNGDLIPLLKKYKLGLGAVPFITPDGRIGSQPKVFRDNTSQEEAKPAESAPADKPVIAEA